MRISWEECDPESGVITQVLGRSYRARARENIKGNAWNPSRNSNRT